MADRTNERRTDRASRVIAAPPEAIFRAFLDPAALIAWLPPTGMRGELLSFEPREGGLYRMALTYQDSGAEMRGKSSADSDVVEGRFVEIVPDRRIVQSGTFESDDPAFAGTMTMTWTFDPEEQGTRVTIIADNVPPGISKADHDAALNASLANLARCVET